MTPFRFTTLVASLALLTLSTGCSLLGGAVGGLGGGLGGPRIPPVYGPYEVKGGGIKFGSLGDREGKIQVSIDVPPDRGTSVLNINAHGGTYDATAAQMTTAFADLKKIGATAGCGYKIDHYQTPSSGDNIKWQAGGVAEVWADVAGLDPDARITRANVCFKALREYMLGLPKYDNNTPEGFEVKTGFLGGSEVWSVENLDKHREALIKQADDRMKMVQKADAKMWDHADVQCTSVGMVTVAGSSSHWVTLQLEMICPVEPAGILIGPKVP